MYTWACGEKHPSPSLSNVPALWSQPHLTGSYKKQQEKSSICFFPLRLHQPHIRETLCNMFALVPCPGRAHGAQRWVFPSLCPSEGGPAASLGYSPTFGLAQPHPGLPTRSSTRSPVWWRRSVVGRKSSINSPRLWAVGSNWVIEIRSGSDQWAQFNLPCRHFVTWAAGTYLF